jgi:putative flippase GtrA
MLETRNATGPIWRCREARFLMVGGGNTVGGYAISSLVYYLLHRFLPLLFIISICTIINVSVSFVTNKFLVFRTRGNYLTEYLRFYLVSAVPIGLSFVLLPIAIDRLQMNPYVAIAAITGIGVVISYFGHTHISFRI